MPSKFIVPPDITGFQLSMDGVVSDARLEPSESRLMMGMIHSFVASYRQLDEWKRKNLKAREFGACEPCFHGEAPCVVISVTPMRVTVRRWSVPLMASDTPIQGEVKWYQPGALVKLTKRDLFEQWAWSMWQCGQRSEQWTTMELMSVAQ